MWQLLSRSDARHSRANMRDKQWEARGTGKGMVSLVLLCRVTTL